MFGILGVDPQQAATSSLVPFLLPPPLTVTAPTMDLSKHLECLSQWPAHLPAGLPAVGALLLLATGGLVVACKVWSFLRVLLSLFVLPGKPVCTLQYISN